MSKLLLYCTKGKLSLRKSIKDKDYYLDNGSEFNIIPKEDYVLNGKIVAECDFEVEEIEDRVSYFDSWFNEGHHTKTMSAKELEKRSCLNYIQLLKYLGNGDPSEVIGYAIHIKNLHIFGKPYELGNALIYNFNTQYIVEKAPQNMMKVYNRAGECLILISIRPEWLCKILNGEKTIEVRKKVLKEMLNND